MLKLSKFDVAERQLCLAIELFFKSADPVAIHTLSEAASQILRDIAPEYSKHSFYRQHPDWSKSERKELNRQLNEARNFFKHADKDPKALIDFNPASNHLSLLETSVLHIDIKGSVEPEVLVFSAWFLSNFAGVFPFEAKFKTKIEQSGLLNSKLTHADCLLFLEKLKLENGL
ncbi:hypothetical protein [Vibrio antiquarius]|uniref:hypothetical protein n=1 Tax=Vibrio antiquarius (strain Ex25) TaxID=150340 RepID=UPI00265A6AD4|nr:hypothetical protein [Vibrio antiquarius]MCR9967351.1 hypothetical protein [Vibrio antiquarius]